VLKAIRRALPLVILFAAPRLAAQNVAIAPRAAADFKAPRRWEDIYVTSDGPIKIIRDGVYSAEQNVLFDTGEYTLQADRVEYDAQSGKVLATGRVVFKDRDATLYADRLDYDSVTQTGTATKVRLHSDPYDITGERVEKTGPLRYIIHDGIITSCRQKVPYWTLRVTRARVDLHDYMRLTNARLHTGPVPLLWIPWILYPIKDTRTTGLLVPRGGYGERSGYLLSNTFYWAPVGWFDSATTLDLYSRLGQGWGQQLRYKPSARAIGQLDGYYINEREAPEPTLQRVGSDGRRWSLDLNHYEPFGRDFLLYADIHAVSDVYFNQQYAREYNTVTRSFNASEVRLSEESPDFGWRMSVKRQEQQFVSAKLTDFALPSINLHLNETRLSNQLTTAAEFEYDALRKDYSAGFTPLPGTTRFDYRRVTFAPKFTWVPLATPLLSAKFDMAGTWQHYTQTTNPLTAATAPQAVDEPLTRSFFRGRASLIGPTLYRTFENRDGSAWRHSLGVSLDYSTTSVVSHLNSVPVYDSLDLVASGERLYTLDFRNRITSKATPDAMAEERFSADLSFRYSAAAPLTANIDGTSSRWGPAGLTARWRLADRLSLDSRYYYNLVGNHTDSVSLSGHFDEGAHSGYLDFSYFRVNGVNVSQFTLSQGTSNSTLSQALASQQARLLASRDFFADHFGIAASLSYNIDQRLWQDRSIQFRLKSQCATIVTQVFLRSVGGQLTRDYRFSVDFLGLGNVLNATSAWPVY
jgi:lipopolysaccharide assembly outer membrane protein LptD (OstA)